MATHPLLTIRPGDDDAQVCRAQVILAEHSYYLGAIDGRFGPMMEAAVVALQRGFNLTDDGIVGPATWQALIDLQPDVDPGPVEPEPPAETDLSLVKLGSMKMCYINDSGLVLDSTLRRLMSAQQKVIDTMFCYDHGHVQLRIGSEDSLDDHEVPHRLPAGINLDGVSGYHYWEARQIGGRNVVLPVAVTDVTTARWKRTAFHEIGETRANMKTDKKVGELGEPDRERFFEVHDPTSYAPPHFMDGEPIEPWVTDYYLEGVNSMPVEFMDSSRHFGETPRVAGVKSRDGFQIYQDKRTGEVTYDSGDYPPGVSWGALDPSRLTSPASEAELFVDGWDVHAHVKARCDRNEMMRRAIA